MISTHVSNFSLFESAKEDIKIISGDNAMNTEIVNPRI